MDDNYSNFAQPSKSSNIEEVKQNLRIWRDTLRWEVEGLIVMKNEIAAKKIDIKVKEKLIELIVQLQNISLKAIEYISEYLSQLEFHQITEMNNKIYTKTEYIRDRYNKILLNIRKMISTSSLLGEIRENYQRKKAGLTYISDPQLQDEKTPNKINNTDTESQAQEEQKVAQVDKSNLQNECEWECQCQCKCENEDKRACDTHLLDKEKDSENNDEESNLKKQDKPQRMTKAREIDSYQIFNEKKTLSYSSIQSLSQELEQIQETCRGLKKSIVEHCIIDNEKRTFEKIKNDNIKMHADLNNLKDDMKDIITTYQDLVKRVRYLEDENEKLKKENTNLEFFIEGNRGQIKYKIDEEEPIAKKDSSSSTPMLGIGDLSPLITVQNVSSFEMMNNMNKNLERNTATASRRRFLVPKSDELGK